MRTLIVLLVVFGLAACEPVEFTKKGGDATLGTDASASADSGSVDSADSVAPAAEVASQPAPDVAQQPPAGACVDQDKDGFCDKATVPDCNDLDSSVNPAATEVCGNNKDDNCDGHIDEGCATPVVSNSLTVTYPSAFQRTLNVQITSVKSDLGKYWDPGSVTATGATLTKDLGVIAAATCLYVRWNVIDSNPATPYGTACVGNGSTAQLDQNAVPSLKLHGKSYGKTDQFTWSAPGGTNAGCSGVFVEGAGCTP